MAQLLLADWAILAFIGLLAIGGLFRGFSGSVAFLLAMAAAFICGVIAWNLSADYLSQDWQRGAATFVVALLLFGIVRVIVKKIVNVLLAQPADALLGFVAGLAAGVAVVAVWAKTGAFLEYSTIVTEAAKYVR